MANLLLQICPVLTQLLQQGLRLSDLVHYLDTLTLDGLDLGCESCTLLVGALLTIASQLVKFLKLSLGPWEQGRLLDGSVALASLLDVTQHLLLYIWIQIEVHFAKICIACQEVGEELGAFLA